MFYSAVHLLSCGNKNGKIPFIDVFPLQYGIKQGEMFCHIMFLFNVGPK